MVIVSIKLFDIPATAGISSNPSGSTEPDGRPTALDDDRDFSGDLSFLLDGPYRFLSAYRSRQGIEILERERVDLVILDLHMPSDFAEEDDDEGIEVLKIIRSRWGSEEGKRIPVIILTKTDAEKNRTRCREFLADAFFRKPPEISALGLTIRRLLQGRKPGP